MSTILNTNGTELEVPQLLDAANFKCAVFTAERLQVRHIHCRMEPRGHGRVAERRDGHSA